MTVSDVHNFFPPEKRAALRVKWAYGHCGTFWSTGDTYWLFRERISTDLPMIQWASVQPCQLFQNQAGGLNSWTMQMIIRTLKQCGDRLLSKVLNIWTFLVFSSFERTSRFRMNVTFIWPGFLLFSISHILRLAGQVPGVLDLTGRFLPATVRKTARLIS